MLNKKEDKIIEGIYTEKKYKKPVKFVATAAMIGAIAGIGAFGGYHSQNLTDNPISKIEKPMNQTILATNTANISSTESVNSNVIDVSNIVEETLPSVVAVNTIIYNEINTGINIFGKNMNISLAKSTLKFIFSGHTN